jgi:hypothetical protein
MGAELVFRAVPSRQCCSLDALRQEEIAFLPAPPELSSQPSFSQSSGSMWAWLRILLSVPTGISCFFGTIADRPLGAIVAQTLTWLPFWLASKKPNASSRRLISRKGCGLRRPNLDLDRANLWETGGLRRLEVKLQRFFQVGKSFVFVLTLARDIDFEALGHIPSALAPDGRGKRSLHAPILSQTTALRIVAPVLYQFR